MNSPEEQRWAPEQYQLLDFGDGRKLERFGSLLLDRPSPAAESARKFAAVDWAAADLVLDSDGQICSQPAPRGLEEGWQVAFGSLRFNLKVTPFGHVGLFPEQAPNWSWLRNYTQQRQATRVPLVALNLFGYTGGTTLALAAAGAQVVHVDASAPAVNWARQNAQLSGLAEHPIRWITEDARKFVARELRRGNHYDVVIMDPPSYGHGPTGKRWHIGEHLAELVANSLRLFRPGQPAVLLLTAHCEQPSRTEILDMLLPGRPSELSSSGRLTLADARGRQLDAGFYVRSCY